MRPAQRASRRLEEKFEYEHRCAEYEYEHESDKTVVSGGGLSSRGAISANNSIFCDVRLDAVP